MNTQKVLEWDEMIKINETVKKGTHLSFQGRRSSEEVSPAGGMGKVVVIKSIHSRGDREAWVSVGHAQHIWKTRSGLAELSAEQIAGNEAGAACCSLNFLGLRLIQKCRNTLPLNSNSPWGTSAASVTDGEPTQMCLPLSTSSHICSCSVSLCHLHFLSVVSVNSLKAGMSCLHLCQSSSNYSAWFILNTISNIFLPVKVLAAIYSSILIKDTHDL